MASLKHRKEYFCLWCKIQLDLPAQLPPPVYSMHLEGVPVTPTRAPSVGGGIPTTPEFPAGVYRELSLILREIRVITDKGQNLYDVRNFFLPPHPLVTYRINTTSFFLSALWGPLPPPTADDI